MVINAGPLSNIRKRRFGSFDLARSGTKHANYHQGGNSYEYLIFDCPKSISVIPTAEDYANLEFFSSDDENDDDKHVLMDEPFTKNHWKEKRRRRVSFGAFVPVIHHLHNIPWASDMSAEEKTNQWLNSKEIEVLKISASTTVQDMRTLVIESQSSEKKTTFRALMAKLEEEKNTSIRGLEHRVFRRKVSRQVLVDEVLECQKYIQGLARFGHAISKEEQIMLLANVSNKRSSSASNIALLNAKNDSIDRNNATYETAVL